MRRIFQRFIDLLSAAEDPAGFSDAMAVTAAALDLSCFAYLKLPRQLHGKPRLITTYPEEWTSHYLRSRYERIDPVIAQALQSPEPFQWGASLPSPLSSPEQQRLFDEASQFGIRTGFTVPIHDGRGPIDTRSRLRQMVGPKQIRCSPAHTRRQRSRGETSASRLCKLTLKPACATATSRREHHALAIWYMPIEPRSSRRPRIRNSKRSRYGALLRPTLSLDPPRSDDQGWER